MAVIESVRSPLPFRGAERNGKHAFCLDGSTAWPEWSGRFLFCLGVEKHSDPISVGNIVTFDVTGIPVVSVVEKRPA